MLQTGKKRAFLTIALALLMAFVLASCSSDDDGTPDNARAERWWNALNAEQMVAALVNYWADVLYGSGGFDSVGEWWETLDCRLMRVAAGDGNVADPMSPYCAHYPDSGHAKILDEASLMHVNEVGMALLGLDDPGMYP